MQIHRYPILRHLRAEPSSHVMRFKNGRLLASARGLSCWFHPLSTSLVEVPCEDRDEPFLFHGRSSDFQEVVAQGVITYRVKDPELASKRFDFAVDVDTGSWVKEPLERISALLVESAQECVLDDLSRAPVREILAGGVERVRARIEAGLLGSAALGAAGLEIVSIRVASVAPSAELVKALQAPTRESIQQASDEAMFQRRALAVEKERAIAENELGNQLELARREEDLISQRGRNEQRRAEDESEARRIEAAAKAGRTRLHAEAEAESIAAVEAARVGAERDRMAIYRDMPAEALSGLALQEMARNIGGIEHLSLSPDLLGPLLERWIGASARRLEKEAS